MEAIRGMVWIFSGIAQCPDLIINTQFTNITLNRLEVNQSIPRCDDYCGLNRACFMPKKEMITTGIA